MGGVDNKATPPLLLTCCRDLIREFMYITATEREIEGEREGGGQGEREGGGMCTNVCIFWKETQHQKKRS